MTKEKYKASRYSHFIPTNEGKVLAFNAFSCGLGQMNKENYEIYQKIVKGEITDYTQVPPDLFEKLKQGNFIIPETRDEIQKIKVNHYMIRFSKQGFGLTIIPTLDCNFACDYCFEPGNPDAARDLKGKIMEQEIQDGILEIAKSNIPEGAGLDITWYGGEPLLGLQVMESLTKRLKKVCDEKKAKYSAGIITNGYLLTSDVVSKLIRLDVSFAQVTIDGPEEIHNQRRPLVGKAPTYRIIIENLKNLSEEIPFSVSIRVNVDERNQTYISELLQDFKRHNLHNRKNISIHFSPVSAYTYSCKDVSEHCIVAKEFAIQELEFYKEAMKLGFNIHTYPNSLIGSCGAIGTGGLVVEPDGTLQTCWTLVGRKDKKVGEIVGSTFQLNDNHDKWLSWSPFDRKGCINCSILPLCMGGCPYESVYDEEMVSAQKTRCVPWKYNLKEMMQFFTEAHKLGLFVPPHRRVERKEGKK